MYNEIKSYASAVIDSVNLQIAGTDNDLTESEPFPVMLTDKSWQFMIQIIEQIDAEFEGTYEVTVILCMTFNMHAKPEVHYAFLINEYINLMLKTLRNNSAVSPPQYSSEGVTLLTVEKVKIKGLDEYDDRNDELKAELQFIIKLIT